MQRKLVDIHQKYEEFGLSYKRIAKETGNCVRTAERTVKDAIVHGWCNKLRNFYQKFMYRVNRREVPGFTFTTKNNGYVMFSNTYTLSPAVSESLSREWGYGMVWF